MGAYLEQSWATLTGIERGRILGYGAIWTTLIVGAGTIWAVGSGSPMLGIPFTVGAVFVGLAEAGETTRDRLVTMLGVTTSMVAITLIAGYLPKSALVIGGAAAVVAFVCGLGGIFGARTAMGGVLTLVTFTLFSAVPSIPATTLLNAGLIGLGGVLVTVGPVLVAGVRRLRWRTETPGLSDSPPSPAHTPLTRATAEHFARHALRLSIATGLTMAVAIYSGLPHAYWLPMTVAWVSRPDASGSARRVEARIVGTLLGLAVAALLILGLGVNGIAAALMIAVASGVTVAFIWANYPIGVAGITVVVMMLFALDGDNVETDIAVRLGSTLLAGAIVVVSSLLLRAPTPPSPS